MEDNKNYENVNQAEPMEAMPEGVPNWFSDDFEDAYKRAVPDSRALSLYRPKLKKRGKLFKHPAFVAVISSLVTCCLCLSIFSAIYQPSHSGSVLPGRGEAAQALGYRDEIVQVVAGKSAGALSIPEVYDLASPAVVSIICKSSSGGYVQSQMSSGSGIIIRQDGYIVTNNHVVDGVAEITVTTIAGQNLTAKVIGKDARTDLAILKVESEQALPFAELGDSSTIRVGEMALAIGNPLREELAGTLTVGYISAINRSMVIDGKQMTMIQTDAAINPGNSGGALLNLQGQVIGINTAKSTGYDVEGLGFAIPINEAKPIIESIIKNGYVAGRPLIGIQGRDVTEAISKANNIPVGVYIQGVMEGSAAAKAGLRTGDVILSCDGKKVTTIDEINKIRDTHKAGDVMEMTVDRNGQTLSFKLTLQEEKPSQETPQPTREPQQYQQQIPSFPFSWFGW